jgi:hypothetical protein
MTRKKTWDGLAFALPSTMIDQTVLTFVDKAQAVSVTISQEKLEGGRPALLRYVTEQLADIQSAVPGYVVTSQTERSAGVLPGIHVQAHVLPAGVGPSGAPVGKKRLQHQLYALDEGNSRVFIATVTAIDGNATQASELLEALASSITVTSAL